MRKHQGGDVRALVSQTLSTTATCFQCHGYGRRTGLKIRFATPGTPFSRGMVSSRRSARLSVSAARREVPRPGMRSGHSGHVEPRRCVAESASSHAAVSGHPSLARGWPRLNCSCGQPSLRGELHVLRPRGPSDSTSGKPSVCKKLEVAPDRLPVYATLVRQLANGHSMSACAQGAENYPLTDNLEIVVVVHQ